MLDGAADARGKRVPVTAGKVEADRVAFKLALPGGPYEFKGVIDGERLRGEAVQGGRRVAWTATRALP